MCFRCNSGRRGDARCTFGERKSSFYRSVIVRKNESVNHFLRPRASSLGGEALALLTYYSLAWSSCQLKPSLTKKIRSITRLGIVRHTRQVSSSGDRVLYRVILETGTRYSSFLWQTGRTKIITCLPVIIFFSFMQRTRR